LPNAIKPIRLVRAGHTVLHGRLAKPLLMPVLGFGVAWFEAPAISRTTFPKVIGENPTLFSTLALAEPKSSSSAFLRLPDLMRTNHSPMANLFIS
jgi:hypothetical protein